ncbi:cation transporter [Shigella flexneri]
MVVTVVALIYTLVLVTFSARSYAKRKASCTGRYASLWSDVMMIGVSYCAGCLVSLASADALFALGIGIYILYSALRMGYDAVQSLLDLRFPMQNVMKVLTLVTSWPGVGGLTIFVRGSQGRPAFSDSFGNGRRPPLVQAHLIAEQVERRFCSVSLGQTSLSTGSVLSGTQGGLELS